MSKLLNNGLNGQWVGDYRGTTGGTIVVNIEERQSRYEGVVYMIESNSLNPSSGAFFRTQNKESDFGFRTDSVFAIDPMSCNPVAWESVKSRYQRVLRSRGTPT